MLPQNLLSTILSLFLTAATTTLVLALASASPHASPRLVPPSHLHLLPHHTLFLRQLPAPSDLQTFNAALGGFLAPPITHSGDVKRPFLVDGSTFTDFRSAGERSCDRQFGACAEAANANGKDGDGEKFTVGECDVQKDTCKETQKTAAVQSFDDNQQTIVPSEIFPDPEFPDFDLICEV